MRVIATLFLRALLGTLGMPDGALANAEIIHPETNPQTHAEASARPLSAAEQAGKRLYQQGLGSNASVIHARVGAAGSLLPASALPCAGCHGDDGRGRAEGGVRPPDITWQRLSTPYGQQLAGGRRHPAYDEAALARAVSRGLDPAGNRLDPAMPRFVMSPRDMANLTAYLKRLADERDPGLHPQVLRLGTLLPASGPLGGAGRMLRALLDGQLASLNEAGGIHGRRLELVVADPGADHASSTAALRELLERGDVFALLAPLAPALDGHYGELLAATGTPLVGPLLTPLPEPSPLLFAPLGGVREQLLALGEFAAEALEVAGGSTWIVHPDEPRQQALAETLAARLRAGGWAKVGLRSQAAGAASELALPADLQALFFLGSADDFLVVAERLAAGPARPYLLAAADQVGGAVPHLPPAFAARLLLAYPALPTDWTPAGRAALQALRRRSGIDGRHAALQVGASSATLLLAEGLRRAGRDASRERLRSALEGLHGFSTGLTPRLDFGPGRQVGAAGAHIVAVDPARGEFRPLGGYRPLQAP